MKPTRIIGDTWYIHAPLNVGWCNELMIDTGINPQEGSANAKAFTKNGLTISALINTHGHPDHCGGNAGVLKNSTVQLYAVPKQVPFIENKEWVNAFMNGATTVPPEETSRFFDCESSKVDCIIPYGAQTLAKCPIEILNLEGHWLDCIGIGTKDNVLFCGDSVLGCEEIEKFKVPLYYDIGKTLNSLNYLKNTDFDYYVPSHGKLTDDIISVADKNILQINKICEIIQDFCKQPATKEATCTHVLKKLQVYESPYQWLVTNSTCGAVLTYLCNSGQVIPIMEDYTVKYKSL